MGLSNEERIERLYYSCDRLFDLGRKLDSFEQNREYSSGKYVSLIDVTQEVWHALLGKNTGDSTNQIGSQSPWSIPLSEQCHKADRKDYERKFYWIDSLTVSKFLSSPEDIVLHIFEESELASYALRRYDDKLKSRYKELDRLISKIQGICFSHFRKSRSYSLAHLASGICNILNRSEVISSLIESHYLHHKLIKAAENLSLSKLKEIDLRLTKSNDDKSCLLSLIEMIGCEMNEYYSDEIIKFAKANGLYSTEIEKLLLENIELGKEEAKLDTDSYSEQRKYEEILVVHGHYIAYDLVYKLNDEDKLGQETAGD